MRAEIERIRAKETSDNPLTAGQQTQISRNETAMEKLEEEIEDLDEVLNDSLRESLGAKRINREGGKKKKKKKKGAYSDSDYSDDDDDDFYDRTDAAKERRRKKEKAKADKRAAERGESTGGKDGVKQSETVETAATLWEKRQVVEAAIEELEGRAAAAEKRERENAATSGGEQAGKADDDLDAFMDQIGAKRDAEEVRRLKVQIGERKSDLERLERLLDARGSARRVQARVGAGQIGGQARGG